jgi:hypothetical protein
VPREPCRREPYYSLARIQALARAETLWASKTRAIEPIIRRRACTIAEALRYATRVVLSLAADDFSDTVILADGRLADVYGCWVDELGWYVKVAIAAVRPGQDETEEIEILSCHPPEYDLRTGRGGVSRGGVWHGPATTTQKGGLIR